MIPGGEGGGGWRTQRAARGGDCGVRTRCRAGCAQRRGETDGRPVARAGTPRLARGAEEEEGGASRRASRNGGAGSRTEEEGESEDEDDARNSDRSTDRRMPPRRSTDDAPVDDAAAAADDRRGGACGNRRRDAPTWRVSAAGNRRGRNKGPGDGGTAGPWRAGRAPATTPICPPTTTTTTDGPSSSTTTRRGPAAPQVDPGPPSRTARASPTRSSSSRRSCSGCSWDSDRHRR
mmetsp:Transcript_17614/g.42389  ORF Transcript_17614/g.42389 Transcript_17614/m.42389 type:complete len:234 (+) Transcript_17614:227-928(+)